MPSRGNNGYIGGVEPRSSLEVAAGVFNSRDYTFCELSGNLAFQEDLDYSDPYVAPTSGGGYGATATVSLKNGSIGAFHVTAAGSGYTSDPTVTFTGGGGSGAEAYVTRTSNTITAVTPWYQVYAVDITYGGEGYTSAPTITFSAPSSGGTTATVTSTTITNGVLTGITFGTTGTRYTGQPTITISTSGSSYPAQVVARLRCGSGYTSAPTIGFSGGGGTNAAATAYIHAELDTVTVTANGSGYTSAPTVTISGLNSSATVTPTISGGQVTAISVSGAVNKFYAPPTVTIGGWPDLPAVSNGDQKLVGAFAIFNNNSNFVAFTCSGNYTVDWGDGTSNNYTANTAANKQYTTTEYAAITNQNVFRGYKVVIITITPQAGSNLTSINLTTKHNQAGLADYAGGWLNIKVAGQNLTSLSIGSTGTTVRNQFLEQFEFVGTNTGLTSWAGMFGYCRGLRKIVALPPSTPTSISSTFIDCYSLRVVPDFTTSAITDASSAFYNCTSLTRLPPITSTAVTNFQNTFLNCTKLTYAPIIVTSATTNLNNTFSSCYNLRNVPPMNTSSVTNAAYAFSLCQNLTTVPDMDLRKCTTTQNMFANCARLMKVGKLLSFASTRGDFMFSGCISLRFIDYIATSKMTTMNSMFQACYNLKELPELDASSCTDIYFIWGNSYSLKSVNIKNTDLVTSSGYLFQGLTSAFEAPWINCYRSTAGIAFYYANAMSVFPEVVCPTTQFLQNIFTSGAGTDLPRIVVPRAYDISNFLVNCSTVRRIESLITAPISNAMQAFVGTSALTELPVLDLSASTSSPSSFIPNSNIRSGYTTGMKYGHSYQNCKLAAAELNTIYTNLGTAVGAQTISVSGNWGTATDDTTIATNKGWTVSG